MPVGEEPPQPRDADPDLVLGGGRRCVVPDRVDQAFDRDHVVRLQQQDGEQRLLPRSSQPDRLPGELHREWSEYSETEAVRHALSPIDAMHSHDRNDATCLPRLAVSHSRIHGAFSAGSPLPPRVAPRRGRCGRRGAVLRRTALVRRADC